ncbi:MAG: class I tRNA ligase family protein [bacterium]|nr:class I tRNA ligase family protein [bacterium]
MPASKHHDFFGAEFKLPELEEKVLNFWHTNQIFEKSLALRQAQGKRGKKSKEFVFYEGPPYANGRPGIHHVLARAFKDIILRYKTMQGFYVPRRAGWDTHGLPTELEVEKQLGVKHKKEIEKLGIDIFNQKARESVWKYKEEWERLTVRMGYWLDLANAYITYKNEYVETLWWITKRISDRGFLKENLKVVPYCPRCQTPLAFHELGMPDVYKKTKDPSVYVKFRIKRQTTNDQRQESNGKGQMSKVNGQEYLLVWTTTPWTLPANLFVAVDPTLTYTKYKIGAEFLWSYNPPPANGTPVEVVEKISGKKLIGLEYEPLYAATLPAEAKAYRVLEADFVGTDEGTGMVHIAPAFGEEDFSLVARSGFPMRDIPVTITNDAHMVAGFPGEGKYIKTADKDILEDLERRGNLYSSGMLEHEYPFCWRCSSALVYVARRAWFFEVSRLRKELIGINAGINWIPAHLRDGRFGEWIKEAKDWAISRERYWGMPLPIWRCEKCLASPDPAKRDGGLKVIGSLEDLDVHSYHKNEFWVMRHTEGTHIISGINASGPEKGDHVATLTAKGRADAEHIAKKLKKEKFDAIYCSPYRRTRETAEIVARVLDIKKENVKCDERLGELNCGMFNWRPVGEHKKFFDTPLEEFIKTPPGGENLTDAKRRMFAALREINSGYRGKKILIVSHGDPLWMLAGATEGLTNEQMIASDYIDLGGYKKITLHNWPYDANTDLDMHRPYVDEIRLECEACKGPMKRVKEVADVWFDSGAMPFAQDHFPFEKSQLSKVKGQMLPKAYPADYICEAIDQTRGWFYTLLAVSTLLGYEAPYKNVICLGLVMDKSGQKMSKSKGNVVDPWMLMEKYGVDAIRWYFYTVNAPEESKNFDEMEVSKTFRRFHLMLYNSLVFLDTYAPRVSPGAKRSAPSVLDEWVLARLNETIETATNSLEAYNVREAALALEAFVEDLSRWYIRRSRRRFQKPESAADHVAASATLGFVLREVGKMTAPFTPFFAEGIYQKLGGETSIHLEDWPKADKKKINKELIEGMAEVRRVASIALAKRAEAGIKVRQPLAQLRIMNSFDKAQGRHESRKNWRKS